MATPPRPTTNPSPDKADEFKTMLEKNKNRGKKSIPAPKLLSKTQKQINEGYNSELSAFKAKKKAESSSPTQRSKPPIPRARPDTKSTSKSSKSKPPIPRANPAKKKSSFMDRMKAASKKSSNTMMKRRDAAKKRNK